MEATGRKVLARAMAEARNWMEQIRAQGGGLSQEDTKTDLVEPLLAALGWRLDEPLDVRREYEADPEHDPLDYALMVEAEPWLVVVVRPLDAYLARRTAERMLLDAMRTGAWFCLLTNGDEYRFYSTPWWAEVDESLLWSFRVSDPLQGRVILDSLGLLARGAPDDGATPGTHRAEVADLYLQDVLQRALDDGDGLLATYLRKLAPDLSYTEVRRGLRRARIRVDFPTDPSAAPRPGSQSPKQTSHTPTRPTTPGIASPRRPDRWISDDPSALWLEALRDEDAPNPFVSDDAWSHFRDAAAVFERLSLMRIERLILEHKPPMFVLRGYYVAASLANMTTAKYVAVLKLLEERRQQIQEVEPQSDQ